MYLPDWIAWGMAEALVLSVGLSSVAVVDLVRQRRARKRLNAACTQVRTEVEALSEQLAQMDVPAGDGEIAVDLLRDRIAALDGDRDPANPRLNTVRRAALSDEAALLKGIQTDSLEDALNAIVEGIMAEAPDAEELQDLKDMLKQVTKDSRAMLECIRELENECERLRKLVPKEAADRSASEAA